MIYIWKEHAYIMAELLFITFMLIYQLANTLYCVRDKRERREKGVQEGIAVILKLGPWQQNTMLTA